MQNLRPGTLWLSENGWFYLVLEDGRVIEGIEPYSSSGHWSAPFQFVPESIDHLQRIA